MSGLRIFLDANVLFSASCIGSPIARLIGAAKQQVAILTSDIACVEARRNLALKRPNWMGGFESVLETIEIVPSAVFPLPVTLAEKDIPLLCAAIRAQCDCFVTGDRRDFGHLLGRRIRGVRVVTPLRLSEILAGRAPSGGEVEP